MGELRIRDAASDEDFAEWFEDLLERERMEGNESAGSEERYLILSDDVGDWIGGARYFLRGGVGHLMEMAVAPEHRHQGHGARLLSAFEDRCAESGAHLVEFWSANEGSTALLGALGWRQVVLRQDYIGHRQWRLLEKRLDLPPVEEP